MRSRKISLMHAFPSITHFNASHSDATHEHTARSRKKQLRSQMRQRRRSLTVAEQKLASRALSKQLTQSRLLLKHQHIALYLANDGELDPETLISKLWQQKKKVYLPVIHPFAKQRLCFCQIHKNTSFQKNRYGISEPRYSRSEKMSTRFLSLVLMPLVAFDKHGNRMGMGGGFYDRSFAFKFKQRQTRPSLIGIAHAFQLQKQLPLEPWDVPLNGVLTDQHYFRFEL